MWFSKIASISVLAVAAASVSAAPTTVNLDFKRVHELEVTCKDLCKGERHFDLCVNACQQPVNLRLEEKRDPPPISKCDKLCGTGHDLKTIQCQDCCWGGTSFGPLPPHTVCPRLARRSDETLCRKEVCKDETGARLDYCMAECTDPTDTSSKEKKDEQPDPEKRELHDTCKDECGDDQDCLICCGASVSLAPHRPICGQKKRSDETVREKRALP